MRRIYLPLLLLFPASAYPHAGGEMSVRIGPEQGILERTEESGFKLSPEAIKRFQLETISAPLSGQITVPADAVMRSLAEIGVYRQREGFLKRIPIQGYSSRGGRASFTATDLRSGDLILVKGIGFVRMVEAAFGSGESDEDHAKHESEEKNDDHGDDDHKNEKKGAHDEHEGHKDEHGAEEKGGHS